MWFCVMDAVMQLHLRPFEFARQQSPQALPMSPLMTIDHKALMTHADLQLV